ncbi:MAG: helix-turn-helix domain-containing protein [Phycisphaerales bacterium]|nr:MAG: helix-turn-helix domain-containing protein [Phycisphaerales bacterium]
MFQDRTEPHAQPLLLTARQTARLLSISERSLYSLTKAGDLPAVRIGRSVRYDPADIRAWIEGAKKS